MADALNDRLREEPLKQVRTGLPVTYKELADRLALSPPRTIHRLAGALEQLIDEDLAAGRPLLAALGVFSGHPAGQEAGDFHAREVRRALRFYGRRAVRAPSRS